MRFQWRKIPFISADMLNRHTFWHNRLHTASPLSKLDMSVISPYQTQGKWTHSSGGEINISVDGTGQSVVINHPTVGKQTLEVRKFCQGDGLDYFGFKGKLDGNKITWNNGVVWTKQA